MVHRILLLVVVLLYACGLSQGVAPLEQVTVEMTNAITPNTALTVHCKSKDDDLGPHVLQNGQMYSFSFKVNWFLTTRFFCNFQWKSPQGAIESKWFDIYVAKPNFTCTKCEWLIKADSVCRKTPGDPNLQCFPYNKQ